MHDTELRVLLAYFIVYFLLAFVWRPFAVYRRTGRNPLRLSAGDDAYGYVTRTYTGVAACVALVVFTICLSENANARLGGWTAFATSWASLAGWLLLAVALPWLVVAQTQMGVSWRIGIDDGHRTELVRRGIFSVSRNPIYLATRVILFGLFLIFPAAATLAVFVAMEILLQVQVRLEEAYLARLHGASYAAYQATVRRWLGQLGSVRS